MDQGTIAYWLTWVGTGAWVVCFWWMHRISTRQDALLTELRELARTQHDILREVHPDVGEIKEHVLRWPLASRIIAGPSRHCCRFMCHRRVGRHPRSEDVPHMHSSA